MEKNNGGEKVTTSILYLFLETIRKVENVNEENQKKKKNEENCYKTSKIIPLALSNLEKTWKRVRWEKKKDSVDTPQQEQSCFLAVSFKCSCDVSQ